MRGLSASLIFKLKYTPAPAKTLIGLQHVLIKNPLFLK